jgi:transcriptional regulator with XRE-family HTH domain
MTQGKKLRKLMNDRLLAIEDVARRAGVSDNTVRRFLNGGKIRMMTKRKIYQLGLGMTVEEIEAEGLIGD